MYLIQKIEQEVLQKIKFAVGKRYTPSVDDLTAPPDPKMGDLTFPCFELAKGLKRSPTEIAAEIAPKIEPGGFIYKVESKGPYVNFFINTKAMAHPLLCEIFLTQKSYGHWTVGKNKKVMVEYAQPNTHKAVHVGHVRNFVLGECIVNLLKASGYDVVAASYHGDVGTHVATTLWGLEKFHHNEEPPEHGRGAWLGKIYAEATACLEQHLEEKKEVIELGHKLENGDKDLVRLWKKTRKWSIEEFKEAFKELGVALDRNYYESEMEESGKKIVAELLRRGIAKESRGAIIVPLDEYGLGAFLILKSDGSTLYATRDLALAKQKFTEYKLDRSINVVDSRQTLYFEQLFKTLEIMGFKKPMVHVPYEFVTLKEGAMSSRKGTIISYEDFRDEVLRAALEETKKRHPDWPEVKIKKTGWEIMQAAIKSSMLSQDVARPIVFDIGAAASFDGFTGPYLQYTGARISSILRKAPKFIKKSDDSSTVMSDLEKQLLYLLARYPKVLFVAMTTLRPAVLVNYLFDLAKKFSEFYEATPVLKAPDALKKSRLDLIRAVRIVLQNSVKLLGFNIPSEM